VQVGSNISLKVGSTWKNGDNYLMANGRCLAYRTKQLRKMHMPKNIVNGDAYFYFENRRVGGTFATLPNAYIYNKTPLELGEHQNQSNRFRNSLKELTPFFGSELANDYKVPQTLVSQAALEAFFEQPFIAVLYFCIRFYTKLAMLFNHSYKNALWKADLSTKHVML
jgi:hypothetical protein